MWCCCWCCSSVEYLLTEGKAAVNAKDKDGTDSLMAASVRGHKEVGDRQQAHTHHAPPSIAPPSLSFLAATRGTVGT